MNSSAVQWGQTKTEETVDGKEINVHAGSLFSNSWLVVLKLSLLSVT